MSGLLPHSDGGWTYCGFCTSPFARSIVSNNYPINSYATFSIIKKWWPLLPNYSKSSKEKEDIERLLHMLQSCYKRDFKHLYFDGFNCLYEDYSQYQFIELS